MSDVINQILGNAYDPKDEMFKVKSVQKKFRDSFSGVSLNSAVWDSVIGAGAAISQASSTLTLGSGVIVSAETYILSKETFTIPVKLNIGLTLSQRIVNQQFFVEFVSIDPVTCVPDSKHCVALVFDGTTATQVKYRVQNGGLTPLDSPAVTVTTTTGTGMYEIEPFADECWFHTRVLDSAFGRTYSYCRHQQIPDPNAIFKVRLRWLNGDIAPTSSTDAVVQFLAVQDYAELTAEITGGRGQTVAGQGLGVNVIGTVATFMSTNTPVAVQAAITNNMTAHRKFSAATTNATNVKATAGKIGNLVVTNLTTTTKFLKLYNKATAPTVGTDIPVLTYPLLPEETIDLFTSGLGLSFATGIGYAITGALADADTTAIGANEIIINMQYV